MKRKRREKRKEKVKKEELDEPWNNSGFNRNTTFWHQNKKKESQKKCQKRKNQKKTKKRLDWWFCRRCFWKTRWACRRLIGFVCGSGMMRKCQMNLQK